MPMCASGSQNLMYLSQSLSTLLLRQGFIIEPRAGWPGNTSNPPVCPLLWVYRCTVTPGSLLGYRDPNSDPHAFIVNTCPLSHLPKPRTKLSRVENNWFALCHVEYELAHRHFKSGF